MSRKTLHCNQQRRNALARAEWLAEDLHALPDDDATAQANHEAENGSLQAEVTLVLEAPPLDASAYTARLPGDPIYPFADNAVLEAYYAKLAAA